MIRRLLLTILLGLVSLAYTGARAAENVTLDIDTVVITYLSTESDTAAGRFVYTFNFSHSEDYPTVLVDVILTEPMALVEGTYSLANDSLSGLQLARNQNDFEANLFYGSAYYWADASLTLKQEGELWRYTMRMRDESGNRYGFSFSMRPYINLYPQPTNSKDKPYETEEKTITIQRFVVDTLLWTDETVDKDGIIDIVMTCKQSTQFRRPYIHLGMYTDQHYPAAGTYMLAKTEENGTFSSSLGMYGNVIIPCYVAVVHDDGYVTDIWFLTNGTIQLSYDTAGRPIVSGECWSYFGSSITFYYQPMAQGLENERMSGLGDEGMSGCRKVLRDGQMLIERGEKVYTIEGQLIK